jgi:hypothetical protein
MGKLKNVRILQSENIVLNVYEYDAASRYIDGHHCCNIEVVSFGTRLNFYYIHDSFVPFLFLFLLSAGGTLRRHMSISMFICYLPREQNSWD